MRYPSANTVPDIHIRRRGRFLSVDRVSAADRASPFRNGTFETLRVTSMLLRGTVLQFEAWRYTRGIHHDNMGDTMLTRRTLLQTAAGAALASAQSGLPKKAKITSSVMLWTLKGSFEERVEIAAKAGMQSVELVAEHVNWTDADAAAKLKFVRSFNLGMDTIIATPDWAKRPVSMVDPAQRDNFLADVKTAITWAQKLEVPQIILMGGNAIPGTHV